MSDVGRRLLAEDRRPTLDGEGSERSRLLVDLCLPQWPLKSGGLGLMRDRPTDYLDKISRAYFSCEGGLHLRGVEL